MSASLVEQERSAESAIRMAEAAWPGIGPDGLPGWRGPRSGSLDHCLAEVATAIEFLAPIGPTLKPNRRINSYRLKHRAERWGQRRGLFGYVSNGALIAAAVFLGFPVAPAAWGSPNAFVGISSRSLQRERPEDEGRFR